MNDKLILVITATDIETNSTHKAIKPICGEDKIIKVYEGDLTYYIGKFGNYNIAHVQSSMGSSSRSSSIMTISTALKLLESKVVIMIGIAFGVDKTKQKIGDVLVSESVIPYNVKRVGENNTIHRGIEAPSSKILLNRFINAKPTWEYIIDDSQNKASLIPTRLLSGEELIDNLEHRNELLQFFPDSQGGEMEGSGVYSACDGVADWIIIKGICDFADGEKGLNKGINQEIAINSALSFCNEIFNSQSAFSEFGISPINGNLSSEIEAKANLTHVLFDIYDISKERFYIKKPEDEIFLNKLDQYGIWIYGPPGCGKSSLIIRNLINFNLHFIQVCFASCVGQRIEEFFKEILYEITSKCEKVHSQKQPQNFIECTKSIFGLLKQYYYEKELIIFIDEIPISNDTYYEEFVDKMYSLIIQKNMIMGLEKVKFVLSSINNPNMNLKIYQQKVHQFLYFFGFQYWEDIYTRQLIELIENELKFSLDDDIKEELAIKSMGSPRFIKKYFRSIFTLNKRDNPTLKELIIETQRELNQITGIK